MSKKPNDLYDKIVWKNTFKDCNTSFADEVEKLANLSIPELIVLATSGDKHERKVGAALLKIHRQYLDKFEQETEYQD